MKLALKFTLFFLLGMGIVQIIFSWLRVEREIALFDEDFRNDHESMGRDLSAAVLRVWELGGESAALAFVDETNANKSQLTIRWVPRDEVVIDDPEHPVEPSNLKALADADKVLFQQVNVKDVPSLRTYIPIGRGDRWYGSLELTESFEKAYHYVHSTIVRTVVKDLVITAVTGGVGLLLGLLLVGRPVRLLVDRTRKLASGNLSDHIVLRQKDELGDLTREINSMCDQLAMANRRVQEETEARIGAIEQLRHADRLRTVGQLTSGIAHELGTPLNVVWERAKMISRDSTIPPTTANSARIIAEQSARMTTIIRQLLDFSRPARPRKAHVELRQVIHRTLTLLQPTLDGHHVAVQLQGSDEDVMADIDVDQIQQVASNLIMNAVHAMAKGGEISLLMGSRHARRPLKWEENDQEYAFFSVTDQGHGITPDDIPRVFDPFFTTKDIGQGTGLGLSISLGIVKEHGGWIEVASELGQGACFTVYLPKEEVPCPVAY